MTLTILEPDQFGQQQGGVWDYISPSRLNCWLSCPLKFKFRYIDGVKTPPTPALFLGRHVHGGLEHFYRHKMVGITLEAEDVAAQMIATWDDAVSNTTYVLN